MTTRSGATSTGGLSRCVLLVEDNDLVRHLAADALRNEGFVVLEAASADDAISQVALVDIVLTDVELSDRSGIDLISVIGRRFPDLPLIAMSADLRLLREATRAGAIAVLAKPFGSTQLRVVMTLAEVAAAVSSSQDDSGEGARS
jgi:CheY-like chemotaxis protein